jgi:uncharacterized membrane protein
MRNRLFALWDRVRSSFWFQPLLMTIAAMVLAFLLVELDRNLSPDWLHNASWIYSGGAAGARAVLQTIAGSMITIAGVVFSLTLVALSIASSQFGSRLLRNFMRDSTNQTVLGTFVATFLYCLLVLRTVRGEDEGAFVPHLSVTLGVLLALASLAMLIFFIHHVSISIQAEDVIARVGADLDHAMDRLYPARTAQESGPRQAENVDDVAGALGEDFEARARSIVAADDGYLQHIDFETLVAIGHEYDVVLRVEHRAGHYLVAGTLLVTASPAAPITPEIAHKVQQAFILGIQRNAAQDVEFGVLQLVEVAVRALSPGINDPFTAIACTDRLGSALARIASRDMEAHCHLDQDGRVRVVAVALTFSGLADAAFNQLRQYARGNADVTIRLLETIAVVAAVVALPQDRATLRQHADMINRGAREALPEAYDRLAVQQRHDAAMAVFAKPARLPQELGQALRPSA